MEQPSASLADRAFAALQTILPHHLLSRCIHWFTRREHPWVRLPFTHWFVKQFRVDLSDAAVQDPDRYRSFNDFFTRALEPGARPVPDAAEAIISPVDGRISQIGNIRDNRLIQAKGHHFTLEDLLGGRRDLAGDFSGGRFTTIYLAPYNYHRIHMPAAGTLREMIYVPGRLFSVNAATTRAVPGLFARNERVVCIFATERGPMAMVLVGALNVGSIETVWAGEVTPAGRGPLRTWEYEQDRAISLSRAEEMGRFNMGSTVILLFPDGTMEWESALTSDTPVRMGRQLGAWCRS